MKDREIPSAEWSIRAIKNGADIVRTHNVTLLKKSIPENIGEEEDIPEQEDVAEDED